MATDSSMRRSANAPAAVREAGICGRERELCTIMSDDQVAVADQRNAPILSAVLAQVRRERVSGHTPGHKRGVGLDPEFAHHAWPLARLDATETMDLDDLYDPRSCIREAQALAARAFGAQRTHLLVGGSTVGVMVAVLAAATADRSLIVDRGAHQCAWNGANMARVRTIAVRPVVVGGDRWPVAGPVSAKQVEDALAAAGDAAAVVITSPTYHGFCADVKAIAGVCHRAGAVLIVDEAHGAHLHFHPRLPTSAVDAGADLVVQSAHKMVGGFTQSAWLHECSDRVCADRVREWLRVLQSSSPSWLLLASLDAARRQLATEGEALLQAALQRLEAGVTALEQTCPGALADDRTWPRERLDPCRWRLCAEPFGCSGDELATCLWRDFGISCELWDERGVLLLFSHATSARDVDHVVAACQSLFAQSDSGKQIVRDERGTEGGQSPPFAVGVPACTEIDLRLSLTGASERLAIERCAGRRSARAIITYPPGIPVVLPGEKLTPQMCAWIRSRAEAGEAVHGVWADRTLEVIGGDGEVR
ncbi:MAG: aminotransferase class V-fold PLP-dependent enzyme [Firmicutes bacterium]|nr:aminotransferase class V-fold PLP-dependent enzyme [Bacillota bacterium]